MQLDSKWIIFAVSRTSDMGNFERGNTVRKEREERDFKVREKLSGFFFDLAKLLLATITVRRYPQCLPEAKPLLDLT